MPSQFQEILEEFEVPLEFPPEVMKEAERVPSTVSDADCVGRKDLRHIPFVTIDGETAKDFDDAVAVKGEKNGFRLWVSIADVSHYVAPGNKMDMEAAGRAASLYLPGECTPMLPEALSNGICSLKPKVDRLSFTAEILFDSKGAVQSTDFYKSVINSKARLTYTIVRQILIDNNQAVRREWADLVPHLELMNRLADCLTAMRVARGSIDFDLPEPEIVQSMEEGKVESIIRAERNKGHRIIEEFMIAANEAVARFLTDGNRPMIYRVHEDPPDEKMENFKELAHNLGFQFKSGKRILPKNLADFVRSVAGHAEERLMNMVLLRSMAKATYSTKNVGHYGLASDCYTHFTSPIRRYPDLVVHRILEAKLKTGKAFSTRSQIEQIATHCSEREREIMKVEYASRDLVVCRFMKDKVGEDYDATIVGVTKFGFFVELDPYFVEGLVSMRSLKDDYYIYKEKIHTLIGRKTKKKYRIGGRVRVKLMAVNEEKRWLDFGPVESA